MQKKIWVLLFIALALGCKKEPSLSFSLESFTEKQLAICENDPCATVTIDYPLAQGDRILAQEINTQIEQWVAAVLFLGEDGSPVAKTLEEAAQDFILAYRDHQTDLPTTLDTGNYEAEVNISVGYQSPELISLTMDHFAYTGGAHGYGGISYHNLNGNTGKEMEVATLFSDMDVVKEVAEREFRKQQDIPNGASINEPGFWFENDQFSLPAAVGFQDEYLLLTYNPYEIAPYSEGLITVKVPLGDIDTYLNFTP